MHCSCFFLVLSCSIKAKNKGDGKRDLRGGTLLGGDEAQRAGDAVLRSGGLSTGRVGVEGAVHTPLRCGKLTFQAAGHALLCDLTAHRHLEQLPACLALARSAAVQAWWLGQALCVRQGQRPPVAAGAVAVCPAACARIGEAVPRAGVHNPSLAVCACHAPKKISYSFSEAQTAKSATVRKDE